MYHALALFLLISQPAPEKVEVCHPEDTECDGPVDLNPIDRDIVLEILKEAVREAQRQRSAELPSCPIEPGRYWNLDCA